MPRSRIELDQAESAFLSHDEHTAIGDSSPHHARGHSIVESDDHTDVNEATPADGDVLIYRTSNNKFNLEDINDSVEGKPRYAATCAYQGSSDDQWLEYFRDISSNDVPFVVAEDSKIAALSVAVESWDDTGGPVTFSVRVNGVQQTTLTITSPAIKAYQSGLNVSLNAGDEISVKAPPKGGSVGAVEYPIFNTFIQVS